jgi:signal transduction histidine kinase
VPDRRLDQVAETVAYYVVAEAIANAHKHSQASFIRVRATASGSSLRIEILDDGVGGAVERPGSGLQGLRDRAEAIGGRMELVSHTHAGTRISVTIPASTVSAS